MKKCCTNWDEYPEVPYDIENPLLLYQSYVIYDVIISGLYIIYHLWIINNIVIYNVIIVYCVLTYSPFIIPEKQIWIISINHEKTSEGFAKFYHKMAVY